MKKSTFSVSFTSAVFLCLLLILSLTACSSGGHTHIPSDAVRENTVSATCTTDGSYDAVVYCSVCNEEISRTHKTVAKSHKPAAAVKENETVTTCKDAGSYEEAVYCTVCGEELSRRTVKVAERSTVHNVQNGECTACKAKESTAGLEFSLNSDGVSYTVIGIGTCTESDIVIDLYNGISVTGIGESAFENCNSLTSVKIGNSVTDIGNYAFRYCFRLTSITIGTDVKNIAGDAFALCGKLIEVINKSALNITAGSWDNGQVSYYAKDVHNEDNTKIVNYKNTGYLFYTYNNTDYLIDYIGSDKDLILPESYDGKNYEINQYAFWYTDITSVKIPDSVTGIGSAVFSDCTGLTSVTVGNGVTSIDSYAFSGCTHLASVTIPNSVTSIGYRAFDGCTVLNYNEYDNAYYLGNESNKYVALIKAKSQEITGCTVNESCKLISMYAFSDCTSLTSITVGDSVTNVNKYAFSGCTGLASVTIGKSVTSISSRAFSGCTSLTSVYYKGTESKWLYVSVSSYNSALTGATRYYYSETEPTETGNYWHYVNGEIVVWGE